MMNDAHAEFAAKAYVFGAVNGIALREQVVKLWAVRDDRTVYPCNGEWKPVQGFLYCTPRWVQTEGYKGVQYDEMG